MAPTVIAVSPRKPAALTLTDPGIHGQLDLVVQLVPVFRSVQAGVRVIGTPQASLLLGHASPVRSRLGIGGVPWITGRRRVPAADVTVTDTGHTWLVPSVAEHAAGNTTRAVANGPLLPGQSATLFLAHPARAAPLGLEYRPLDGSWSRLGDPCRNRGAGRPLGCRRRRRFCRRTCQPRRSSASPGDPHSTQSTRGGIVMNRIHHAAILTSSAASY